jgi:photosystem II stability/assembly factor-like uncharacterized protein
MNLTNQNQVSDVIYNLAASPNFASDQTLFAARASGLHRSQDGGLTWQSCYDSLQLQAPLATLYAALSPDFPADRTVFAAVAGGVLRSTDGGQTWTSALLPPPPPVITALAISPDYAQDGILFAATMDDGIFRSADRGARWTAWNFGLYDFHIFSVAISPAFAHDQTVFLGCESGMFRSANKGLGWRELDFPIDHAPVLSLALSPHFEADGTLWAGTEEAGLFCSRDRGQSWELAFPAAQVGAVNAILAAKSGAVLALGDETLWISCNGGKSWQIWRADLRFEDQPLGVAAPRGLESGAALLVGLANGEILQV